MRVPELEVPSVLQLGGQALCWSPPPTQGTKTEDSRVASVLSALVTIQKCRLPEMEGDTLQAHCTLGVTPTLVTAPRWHGRP